MHQHAEIVAAAHELFDFDRPSHLSIGRRRHRAPEHDVIRAVIPGLLEMSGASGPLLKPADITATSLHMHSDIVDLRSFYFDNARPVRRALDHHGAVLDMGQPCPTSGWSAWAMPCPGWSVSAPMPSGSSPSCRRRKAPWSGRRRAVRDRAGLRRGTAAARFLHRPHPAGPFAGICRKPARDAERDLAGAVARRPASSSWCPTGAASGRASSTRRSAMAGLSRAAS